MVVPSLSLAEHTAGEMKKRVDIVHQRGIQFGRGAYSMNLQEQREENSFLLRIASKRRFVEFIRG